MADETLTQALWVGWGVFQERHFNALRTEANRLKVELARAWSTATEQGLRLKAEVKRLKAAEVLSTEGFLGLTKMFNAERADVVRLKVALVVRDVKNDRLRAEGMEAAAVHLTGMGIAESIVDSLRKWAAEEQTEPEENCPRCGRPHDLILDEDGKVHVAAHDKPEANADHPFCDDGAGFCRACGNDHLAHAGWDDKPEADANNAAHRDGGYSKEQADDPMPTAT